MQAEKKSLSLSKLDKMSCCGLLLAYVALKFYDVTETKGRGE